MKRYIILGGALIFALMSAAVVISLFKRPTETDYRLARGRSQFFTLRRITATYFDLLKMWMDLMVLHNLRKLVGLGGTPPVRDRASRRA